MRILPARTARSLLALALAALALGCAGHDAQPTSTYDQRLAAGRELYETYCIACHGADGERYVHQVRDLITCRRRFGVGRLCFEFGTP